MKSQVDFSGFALSYKAWAYWQSIRSAQQMGILLGSEDKTTFGITYWIPGSYFVMSSFKDIVDHNQRLIRTYEELQVRAAPSAMRPSALTGSGGWWSTQEAMKHARVQGPQAVEALLSRGATRDEGMALVLQILMMGECDALFGSYASNVAILVHDLQHSRQLARKRTLQAVDVNGR
ncbi:MAG: hypothetical protein SGPRY_012102, partial [Prymnesium sp.]